MGIHAKSRYLRVSPPDEILSFRDLKELAEKSLAS